MKKLVDEYGDSIQVVPRTFQGGACIRVCACATDEVISLALDEISVKKLIKQLKKIVNNDRTYR